MPSVSPRLRASVGDHFPNRQPVQSLEHDTLLKMVPDIVYKLSEEFAQDITSERQVVYILVEIRKLLEKKDDLDKYPDLKLCCDWATHPKLDRKSAQRIAMLFDRYEAKYRRDGVGVNQAEIPELVEFCEHSRFRAQFIEACESNDVPTGALRNDDWWRFFLEQFSEVVRDCPLEAKGDSTTHVTRVTASAISPESIGVWGRQFAICWTWYRNDTITPGTAVSLF